MAYTTKQFAEFEKENNLFSLTYNGVSYWQLLRFPISERCLYAADDVEITLPKENKTTKFAKLFMAALKESFRQKINFSKINKADVLLFYTTDTRIVENEKVNPFFDFINTNELTFQKIWDTQDFISLPEEATANIAPAVLSAYVHKVFMRIFKRQKRDVKAYNELCEVIAKVNETFKTNITQSDINNLENEILYLISANKGFVPYFKRLLNQIEPKAIVVKCYYMVPCLMMIKAANELGIPVVELEHGHIYNHISYCFEDKSQTGKLVPDVLFAFNEFFANECSLTEKTKIEVTGYPFLEKSINCYAKNKLNDLNIVFYSQPSLGQTFADFIVEFAQMSVLKGYRAICKLHPLECEHWRTMYPQLAKAQTEGIVTVDDKRQTNVYSYMAVYKHQVVADSTAAFEIAAVEGAKLYIPISCPHRNTQPMLDNGFAIAISTPEQMLNEICAQKQGESEIENNNSKNSVRWPKNSQECMNSKLVKIANSKK